MIGQSDSEVVVVDYGCAEGTADWVRSNHPGVRLVEVEDDPGFCLARGRNIGASYARGKFLLFCDADVVLKGDFANWVRQFADERRHYLALNHSDVTVAGTVICSAGSFREVRGYDEAYRSWGGEDREIYERLSDAGIQQSGFPVDFVYAIEHGDDLRQVGHGGGEMDNRIQAIKANDFYRTIKQDITRLGVMEIELNARIALMKEVQSKVKKFEQTGRIQDGSIEVKVVLDVDKNKRLRFERQLIYRQTN
jgi:glycosyltransferase involved in cell wall biosynthesis